MKNLRKWRGEVLLACVCVFTVVFAALWTRGDDLRRIAARNAASSEDETLSDLTAAPLWVRPVAGEAIEEYIGARRTAGGLWEMRPAVRFAARPGQAVVSMAEGTVLSVSKSEVRILHPDGVEACYGLLGEVLVQVGRQVRAGERIGTAAGEAVSVSVRRDGAYFDPCSLPFS